MNGLSECTIVTQYTTPLGEVWPHWVLAVWSPRALECCGAQELVLEKEKSGYR